MFTKKSKARSRAEAPRRGPGRPPGRTRQGDATRQRLYGVALKLIARNGYEDTSLRDIARAARQPGLLYKYFPSKRDLVLTLHETLSADYARRVRGTTRRRWVDSVFAVLETSIATLRPHRDVLVALIPVLVSNEGDGVLSPERVGPRLLVQDAFVTAVTEADDAPDRELGEALGRLLYIAHLLIVLLWLLDKSDQQRATARMLEVIDASKSWIAFALVLPQVRALVEAADALIREGLLRE